MGAYYNENAPNAAAWLRELIRRGLIAPGEVDERDLWDVAPADLHGYTQCHFFAGIGGWSYALRLAGWADERPVWTGSCPCQPFSAAGQGAGFADERHLWPAFFHLIGQCRPATVFGEQVASPAGLAWLDLVSADLEGAGYAFGAADLCAAGVGAPHIRQRLYFVAHSEHGRREVRKPEGHRAGAVVPSGAPRWLADGERFGRERRKGSQSGRVHDGPDAGRQQGNDGPLGGGETGTLRMAYPDRSGQSADSGAIRAQGRDDAGRSSASGVLGDGGRPGPTNSFWRDADWLFCRDGKWRPVEPGTFPLGNGLPARVGRLRGYGNAVVPQVAAEFVASYLDVVAEAGRTNQ